MLAILILTAASIAQLDPHAAQKLVVAGEAVFLDVREAPEVRSGMPASAMWLPRSRIERDPAVLDVVAPRGSTLIFCCGTGVPAPGRKVFVLDDYTAWQAAGLAVKFVSATQTVLTGKIVSVLPGVGDLAATVQVNGEKIRVLLGPAWLVIERGVPLLRADEVVVRGSTAAADGARWFVAVEIERGGKTLPLRSNDGKPLWPRR
jgi:hypothetical protein